jgi:hypothetical protein
MTTRTFVATGGVVLGFALQDAARAAQVQALLTSSRFRLRPNYFAGEMRISSRGLQGERERQAPRRKGKTTP